MNTCKHCQTILTKHVQKIFCSRSCAAKHNNTIAPKRKKKIVNCVVCQKPVDKTPRKFCQSCINDGWVNTWPDKPVLLRTLGEELSLNPYKGANRYNRIRAILRYSYLSKNKEPKCSVCGYSRHIELCHKIPIRDFSLESLIKDINHPDNVLTLCPNHHWEFDNGLIKL